MVKKLGFLWLALALTAVSCQPKESSPKPVIVPPVPIVSPPQPAAPPYTEISMKSQGQRVPVIMYHDIIAKRGKDSVWFDTTEDEFRKEMDQLQEWGANVISLTQLYDHLTKGDPVPENSIVLTFDDNYQGFYDHALPILRERNYPAAVFVHTGFVGNKTGGHPKMDWTELKELVNDPLITIGNHTITHPADMTKLSPGEQEHEVVEAKAELEKQLGKPCDFFAYPEGSNDEMVQEVVRSAGHKMAFTIANSQAEESPNIMAVGRYINTRLKKAWDDRETAIKGGVLGVYKAPLSDRPVKYQEVEEDGIKLGLITGGHPMSVMSETREGVLDFIHRTPGAVAGINGGFFAMAAIASTDNQMVGPCKTADMPAVIPDEETFRWEKLHNRPLVMWDKTDFAIVPFAPSSMRDVSAFSDFMPDMTDCFLAGVWLVHGGVAQEREAMNTFSSKDIQDPRKRAFMGVMNDGSFIAGASLESVSSANLASALASAGVAEAVLLDSGFSTSLVYGESIKAFGHSSPTNPSRPVPHAVVIMGSLDPETSTLGVADEKPKTDDQERPRRRRRHRK